MAKSGKSDSDDVSDKNKDKPPENNIGEVDNQNESNSDSVSLVSKPVSTSISILIESLVKNLCSAYEPDVKKASILYQIICDKLFDMKMIDESYQMNEFEGMRSQYQKAFFQILKNAVGGEKPLTLRPVWPDVDESNSHYYREFDEIEYIAGGGFGHVYRVKHKLDGSEYAVKKILIRSEGIESVRNYLSEVKTFASMNHSNVVQYKAAWLELGVPSNDPTMLDDTDSLTIESSNYTNTKIKEHIDDEYIYHQDVDDSFSDRKEDNSDFEIDFEHSVASQPYSESNRTFCSLRKPRKTKRSKRNSISEGGMAICTLDYKEIHQLRTQQKRNTKWATLYIQMALCQSTLKQWLEKRNGSELPKNPEDKAIVPVKNKIRDDAIFEILRQLLMGLEYIHSKGIVHHDIKPSNIFIQLENGGLLVQLGDFGLACPLQSVRHSLALGTKLYAAPEQLAGKCDPKSDMYSLGIILFELVETFRTDMERVQYISELRKGHLPSHLPILQSQWGKIIAELVTKNYRDRPDASTLLKTIMANNMPNSPEAQIEALRCQIAQKDEEIARLRALLESTQGKDP